MKKTIALCILFASIVIFFRQFFLQGLLPIPSDTLIGLYHPFRDAFAQRFPRGIPFKNFLITDPIRQQFPWRYIAISLEKQFQLPLWNPYSFSGYPLLANFQSGTLYPLNILFFLLPFSFAWSVLIIAQPLLASIFVYLYLRNVKLHWIAALLGGIVFAFSGFSIAWLEWNTILQTFLWVPLILLAKDKLIVRWTKRWMLIFLFAEITSFLAGHLQVWFYALMVTNAYLFIKIFQKTKQQQTKNFFLQYQKNYFSFFLVGLAMFIFTAIQWIPTVQFILLSARSIDQNYSTTVGWFIPWQHLVQFIAPDFFGNPTTLNYWGVWNYAELVGYIGILPFIFALFAILARHDKKTYFWGIFCFIALIFSLPTPLARLPYLLHIPLLSTSQPTRLMVVIDFSLAILAALGIDHFIKIKSQRIFISLGVIGIALMSCWIFSLRVYSTFGISLQNIQITRQNLLFPSGMFLLSALALIVYSLVFTYKKFSILLQVSLLILVCIDVFRFGWKFTPFVQSNYLYPSTAAINFLQKNIGNYRFMTTDSQILPPNVSDIYHLQSIEGYDPLYVQTYGQFIVALQRNKPDIASPFGFNRIITPHEYQNPLINLLGVKYILSFNNLKQQGLQKVFQENQTKIYENKNVLPRAFFVNHIIPIHTQQNAIDIVFANSTILDSLAVVNTKKISIAKGLVSILSYEANAITLTTQNSGQGFLVLTDVYYPTWHAYIDNKETKIYQTDFTLRGIFVPEGRHEVEFRDQLL